MHAPRIAVVGTGTIGVQVLWNLARQGLNPVGYELYQPGHPRGAAGGESRLFRFIELEDIRYLPVVTRANELWDDLQDKAQTPLRDIHGALTILETDTPAAETAKRSADVMGDRCEGLSRDDVADRFPDYVLGDNEFAIVDKDAGTIFPDRAISATAALAQAHGASIRTEARVLAVTQRGDQVVVTTAGGEDMYDKVVVAAGAWTSTLLPEVSPFLAPRRLLSTWFLPQPGHDLTRMLPYIHAEPHYSYGLPTADGSMLKLGLGFNHHKVIESPDAADLVVTEDDLVAVRTLVHEKFPNLQDYPARINPYFESYTTSRIEYVSEHPTMSNVIVMAGFSGKGFKTSPALGELGAQLALDQDIRDEYRFIVDHPHTAF